MDYAERRERERGLLSCGAAGCEGKVIGGCKVMALGEGNGNVERGYGGVDRCAAGWCYEVKVREGTDGTAHEIP